MADDATSPDPIVVVNIMCTSYSGATWLNLTLGAHSQAFPVGELDAILKREKAICSVHGEACPVWSQVDPKGEENLYLQIARASGKRVLIVNKSRRLLEQQNHPGIRSLFVFVVRDGRAVVASSLRKFPDKSTISASRWWVNALRKKQKIVNQYPAEDVLQLRYETLNSDREAQYSKLCEFIGLPFEPEMLAFTHNNDAHFIGGNGAVINTLRQDLGTKAPEVRYKSQEGRKRDHEFYKKNDATNFVDERWRNELTPMQLRTFALIAGRANRKYGYPSGWDPKA